MIFKFFRRKRNFKIIMWTTAILIIPGFLIWGVGIGGGSRTRYLAASVNREPITQREFYQKLDETERNYRNIFGDRFDEIAKNLNLEKGVLEELVREKIMFQQARRRHIKVSDAEVVEAIKSDPAFRDEKGNFSQEKFSRVIGNIPPEELRKIEQGTRDRIFFQKLKQQVVTEGNVQVTDAEVDEYLQKNKPAAKATDKPPVQPDREQVRKGLLWQKGEKYFQDWYTKVRNVAKVTTYVSVEKQAQEANQ